MLGKTALVAALLASAQGFSIPTFSNAGSAGYYTPTPKRGRVRQRTRIKGNKLATKALNGKLGLIR